MSQWRQCYVFITSFHLPGKMWRYSAVFLAVRLGQWLNSYQKKSEQRGITLLIQGSWEGVWILHAQSLLSMSQEVQKPKTVGCKMKAAILSFCCKKADQLASDYSYFFNERRKATEIIGFIYYLSRAYPTLTNYTHAMLFLILVSR